MPQRVGGGDKLSSAAAAALLATRRDSRRPPACVIALPYSVQGLSAPTLQSSLNYLLLGIVYTTLHVRAVGWRLKCRWWAYALLALLDVEGNFCLVLAYRYTSLTRCKGSYRADGSGQQWREQQQQRLRLKPHPPPAPPAPLAA